MDERFPAPGWFLRPETWAHQMPQAFLGAPPVWPGHNQTIAPRDLSPSSISFAGEHPVPTPPDQPLWAPPAEQQGYPQAPSINSSNNAMATSEPPAVPRDFRTRLLEALSDKNIRYYAGPGFSEFLEKLAGLATLLPGSGTVQGTQDSARATDELRAGNYGKAAVDLATATANTALDWIPAGKLAMLGGMLGRTFPWSKLRTAEAMEQAGKSADEIWRATGLERGADDMWRYEITDRGFRVDPRPGFLDEGGFRVAPLYEHYIHPGMQEAYPEFSKALSKLRVDTSLPSPRGMFSTGGTIWVEAPSKSHFKFRGTHELQHMIDHFERHARGGSPMEFMKPGVKYEDAYRLYELLAGEVAARNAVERLYKSEQTRARRSPQWSEDKKAPREKQIVQFFTGEH